MKKHNLTKMFAFLVGLVLAIGALMVLNPSAALAEDNTATGDYNGGGTALGASTFTLSTATLTLTKTAFLTDGTAITSGNTLAAGTTVQFMIYIDNTTDAPVNDVTLQDVLVPATFAYSADSLQYTTQATGTSAAALRTAILASGAKTDAVDGDVVSYAPDTIDIGDGTVANATLNIPAGTVWGMLFVVTMQ